LITNSRVKQDVKNTEKWIFAHESCWCHRTGYNSAWHFFALVLFAQY
jgi:hypothetical protein